jgi:hypothetical protein
MRRYLEDGNGDWKVLFKTRDRRPAPVYFSFTLASASCFSCSVPTFG